MLFKVYTTAFSTDQISDNIMIAIPAIVSS